MGIFRSEEFVNKRIRIPRESAGEILNELGKLEDCMEFIDLNKELEVKKNFASMIKRCEEMEKKIITIERQCESYGMRFYKYQKYDEFVRDLEQDQSRRDSRVHGSTYFDLIENEVIEDERKLFELIDSYGQIEETLDVLYERREVLIKASQLVASHGSFSAIRQDPEYSQNFSNKYGNDFNAYQSDKKKINPMEAHFNQNLEEGNQMSSDLNLLAGVVNADDEMRLKRMVFRISKGRAISTFWNLDYIRNQVNPHSITSKEKDHTKKIFAIFFQGGTENVLQMKILKILDIFQASRYNVPRSEEISFTIDYINKEIKDKLAFIGEAEGSISNFLSMKCGDGVIAGKYSMYKLFFRKEKIIYNNLNKCLLRDTFIDGEVWIPTKKLEIVTRTLKDIFKGNEDRLTANLYDVPQESSQPPPTYIPTNDFLWAFQEIVDTYGIPRYQEINPTYFNIVTFPFLFGIMFGDIGHGFLLFLFGCYLCLFNNSIAKDETNIFRHALKGRYLVLMMGFFAFYCGFLYNDFFSVPFEFFGTCYNGKPDPRFNSVSKEDGCEYVFGMDPKWYVSSNELTFFNSFKMKFSVIIGVIHMLFGIILRGLNSLYFRNYVDFTCEFIPQFLFMTSLFGYMDVLIYLKWATYYPENTKKDAPSIISTMMGLFLDKGKVKGIPLWGGNDEYSGRYIQEWAHLGIVGLALILVPIMLFVKPIIENSRNKKNKAKLNYDPLLENDNQAAEPSSSHQEHHSFGEIFIHQVIETIEFVLGAVSNTASYLRLWALSLAHGQLSKVFFQKTIATGLSFEEYYFSIPTLFLSYFIFASVTFFVLMCMDMMECFLHTLRLHWVEFQNKFYKADGYKFRPYSFKFALEQQ